MSNLKKKTVIATLLASLLALFGCGKIKKPAEPESGGATVVEEIPIKGFDSEAEPVIKKWSDGTIWLHFEAMPPFFAEAQGREADFRDFEQQIQRALGVPVTRIDREIFAIQSPLKDTAAKAKSWLEAFHNRP